MRFPFVSRERYAHETGRLEDDIIELKQERERLLDYIASHSVGSPIYSSPKPKAETQNGEGAPPSTPDSFAEDVREAFRAVGRNPRRVTEYISRKNTKRANQAAEQRASYAMTQAEVAADLEATIDEGKQAAQGIS